MDRMNSKLVTALRLSLGAGFLFFGLNGFFHFAPMPPMPDRAGAFLGALAATGYMFPLIKGTEVVAGLLLLSNRFVPLALVLLAPVLVNILAFHVLLAPAGTAPGAVLLLFELALAYAYRASFRGVLAARAEPATASETGGPVGVPVAAE
ncbi:MAG: DoxX family protein [Polyangiales bacterium]